MGKVSSMCSERTAESDAGSFYRYTCHEVGTTGEEGVQPNTHRRRHACKSIVELY